MPFGWGGHIVPKDDGGGGHHHGTLWDALTNTRIGFDIDKDGNVKGVHHTDQNTGKHSNNPDDWRGRGRQK